MANAEFDAELFEKKLHTLKDSQESIQSLSSWCLERREHHKKIVATWLQVLKKVKVEHRLTLFYLANDVIQYSKRKNYEFVESWGTTLQRATTMVRDEKVKHRILRIFKIWEQRQVYDEEFLTDLSGLISAAPKKKIDPQPVNMPEEFQAALLISTMRSCSTLETATDARLKDLRDSNIDIDNAEELCASLKDRRRVEDAEKEVETAVKNIENYVRALEAEIRERVQVLELLEQADQFYETQRGEVKIVTNAYRNFGSRVKNLKKKLDELLPTLTSPIPSPDVNAPSPSPDSDIELPGDDQNVSSVKEVAPPSMYGSYSQDYEPLPVPAPDTSQGNSSNDFTSNFSSFIGGNIDFDMRSIFNDKSPGGSQIYNEAMPIEVINMRPSKGAAGEEFPSGSFLKVPEANSATSSGGIPGLGLDLPEPRAESPQRPDYTHLERQVGTTTPRMGGAQGERIGGNHQIGHSTPLARGPGYSREQGGFEGTASSVNPLPPPPLPPPIFLEEEGCYNKLPPKFPTWTPANEGTKEGAKWETGKNSWSSDNGETERWESPSEPTWSNGMRGKPNLSETPESPPIYEKSSFTDPVQYNDSQTEEPILSSAADVDHRVIPIPLPPDTHLPHRLMKVADVDHRNLISLIGSPANNSANSNESQPPTGNNLWSGTDQDYRRQNQPGDIVESVDMEMSDEETDSKQKNRILVDVRAQDRDMRPGPLHHVDMDMRVIPLPSPIPRNPPPDLRNMHPGPPLPPLPPYRQNHPDFPPNHPNHLNFRGNPNLPPNFLPPQPDFPPDFHPNRPDMYDFQENQHPDFHDDRRFPPDHLQQHPQHHRDSPMFLRGRGRPFPRGRRERFPEGPPHRRHRPQDQLELHQEAPPPGRLSLLQPPETVVILDDNGMPIMPDMSQDDSRVPEEVINEDNERPGAQPSPPKDSEPSHNDPGDQKEPETPGDCEEITSEERSQEGSLTRADEPPRNLSEHLEALMNSGKPAGVNDLKRQASNGSLEQLEENQMSPSRKRAFMPNNGPPELYPVIVYDYEGQHGSPNFRGRLPTPVSPASVSPFAPWRGGGHPQRGRGGFRGSPRAPWMDRGPRGPPNNFSPRGGKRGNPFRGNNNGNNGFRGRGRAGNW
ncbi:serine/arginine repetitive matrix protein 1 [Diachasma alloeum]|uniref:serine/arginine repetitive matrix protein 1 n=1 Tax=Diachasma alloeum TaxID=454923 RepID=UPI0007384713|nr:serine/arginine repetitive matrix protein 1 [Diachasma alloeum]